MLRRCGRQVQPSRERRRVHNPSPAQRGRRQALVLPLAVPAPCTVRDGSRGDLTRRPLPLSCILLRRMENVRSCLGTLLRRMEHLRL